jgi:DNA-binding response OmpR family regulator
MAEKILVVEDELVLRETLTYNLVKQGYEVSAAADGQQAVVMARQMTPDLILLDIMLPKLDGFEVCRLLRQELGRRYHAHAGLGRGGQGRGAGKSARTTI